MPPTKWYINLLKGNADNNTFQRGKATNHGPKIPLVATRKLGHGVKVAAAREAEWTLAWAPADHDAFFTPGTLLAAGQYTQEDAQKRFVNAIKAPPIGGLTFTVKARKRAGQGASNVSLDAEFTTWRRIYYTVNFMNARCKRLFEAVEDDFKAAFAGAFIELKRRQSVKALGADEPMTLQSNADATLSTKHAGALDRTPFHLRMVLVNDIASEETRTLQWTMVRTTATPDVTYAGTTITVQTHLQPHSSLRGFRVTKLVLTPSLPPVAVAPGLATRPSDDMVHVAMSDPSVSAAYQAVTAHKKVTVTGKLRGRELGAGVGLPSRDIKQTITDAHIASAPLVANNAALWVAGGKLHVELRDGSTFRTPPTSGVCITPSWQAKGTWASRDTITRVDDTHIHVDLASIPAPPVAVPDTNDSGDDREDDRKVSEPDAQPFSTLGAGDTLTLSLTALIRPPVVAAATADHNFSVSVSQLYHGVTVGNISFKFENNRLEISTPRYIIDDAAPLSDVTLTVADDPIDVTAQLPDDAIASWENDNRQLDIKLAHASLHAARDVLAADRTVDVSLEYKWIMSLGGYYTNGSNVVVLTCLRIDGEAETRVQKRLLVVACHELGHAFGLVRENEKQVNGAVVANNRRYTDAFGGRGSHCSFNAHTVANGLTTSGQIFTPDNGANTCIMFHTMRYLDQMDGQFCDQCKAQLLRNAVRFPQ